MSLKPNSAAELTRKLEEKILPLLRKQKGFQDELVCISTDGGKAFGLSLWDGEASAEAYARDTYPEITKILSDVVEGSPKIYTYSVANSTFHKIASAVTV
jgi:hypothetical protein